MVLPAEQSSAGVTVVEFPDPGLSLANACIVARLCGPCNQLEVFGLPIMQIEFVLMKGGQQNAHVAVCNFQYARPQKVNPENTVL